MGKRRSLYLTDADDARWKALGVPGGVVFRAGLDALETPVRDLAGIPVVTGARMPDGVAAVVAPGSEPVVLRLPEAPQADLDKWSDHD